MKRWIITVVVGVASFAGGCLTGWFLRKRQEIRFEEVTEEELDRFAEEDMEKRAAEKDEKKDSVVPNSPTSKTIHETIDTQKTQYWAMWQDEAGKYKQKGELPEDEEPVITEEDVENVNLDEDLVIDEDEKLPVVEMSDEEEYNAWLSEPDGEYSAVEMTWFSGDNVVLDNEDNTPITNVIRCLGFDPKKEFEKMGVKKDESAVLYRRNNVLKTIFQVTQYPSSYSKRTYQEEFGGDDDG